MADSVNIYEVGVDPSGVQRGMQQAVDAVKKSQKEIADSFAAMQNSMKQLNAAFQSVVTVFAGLTAAVAGGKAFKEVIDASNQWTGEAKKLSMQLGISTERASVMMVAMRKMGMDSDTVSAAVGGMTRQISTNADAFAKLGVKVRDSGGQYRPVTEVMQEVNAKLGAIKNTTEQNIAGMQVYGKQWSEVRGVLRLTADEIKNAEQKAKDLGLVVGDEQVAQTKKYKESINDLKLVTTSLEVQFGNAVLPAFVKMGGWLSSTGPAAAKVMSATMESLNAVMSTVGEVVGQLWSLVRSGFAEIGAVAAKTFGGECPDAMTIFTNALKVIELAFVGFKTGFMVVLEVVKSAIDSIVGHAMRVGNVISAVLRGDFEGAKQAWVSGGRAIESAERDHYNNLVQIAQDGREKMLSVMDRPAKSTVPIKDKAAPTGGPTYDFSDPSKLKSRLHEWESRLLADKDGFAKQQAIEGTAREYSLEQERDYWRRLLDTVKMSKEERAGVEKKYYVVQAEIRKRDFEQDVAAQKVQLENYRHNHLQREEIAERIYKQTAARYGEESKEARAAYAEIIKEQRAYEEQKLQISRVGAASARVLQLAQVDAEEADARFKVEVHQMTQAQLLAEQERFEQQRYQIKLAALREQEQLMHGPDEDPVALAALHAQIEQMAEQHQQRIAEIKRRQFVEDKRNALELYGTLESGMQRVIAGTLNGSIRMSNIMQSMLSVVAGAVVDMIAKMAAQWIMQHLVMKGVSSVLAVGEVTSQASVAGAAAIASTAAIPVIGPEMAPAAGAAAFSAAMAFLPTASAAGGYDIPSGLNPIVQTHAREMILPAQHADVIRSLANRGDQSAAGGQVVVNYHDNSGRLTEAEIRRNASAIHRVLNDQKRKA